MTGAPEHLIKGLGFAVREIPLPAWLSGAAYALVVPEYGDERLERSGARTPILALAAGAGREEAGWRLAAHAARLRSRSATGGFGAGAGHASAMCESFADALTRRGPGSGAKPLRLVGWQAHVPSPVHPEYDGELTCRLLAGPPEAVLVESVLSQSGGARSIVALGCGTTVDAAVRAAFGGVLARAAVGVWAESSAPEPPAGEIAFEQVGAVSDEDFRTALRESTQARILYGTESGVIVGCERAASDEKAASEQPGPVLDLSGSHRTPIELSLACPPERVSLSRAFHENSKLRGGFRTMPAVDVERLGSEATHALSRPYRDYGRVRTEYPLANNDSSAHDAPLLPLDVAVRGRRSAAPMTADAIPMASLTRILGLSAGITATARTTSGVRMPLRATPTAGGLCSNDLFVLARRVDGMRPGLYYFHPGRRVVQLLDGEVDFEAVANHTGYASRVDEASAIFVYVGAFRRNQWKYGNRGYRNVLIECGHLAQSVVVAAAALDMVAHPLIGFVDDYFNGLVGVNGLDDAVLYLTLLGGKSHDR